MSNHYNKILLLTSVELISFYFTEPCIAISRQLAPCLNVRWAVCIPLC